MPLARPAGSARCALLALAAASIACENHPALPDAGPSEPSPNASILPAPLATGAPHAPADAAIPDASGDADAGEPVTVREDIWLPFDAEELHDVSGLALKARFRWLDVVPPPRLPETNADLVERARAASTFDVTLELGAAGRMRLRLASNRFLLPEGTEIRARRDLFGHALIWPDGQRYVVVQPGALRAILNERRADSVPLASANPTAHGEGQALGFETEKSALATPLGRLELEQARVPATGAGGALLCRFLVELAGQHPRSAACASDLVPVRAEFVWTEGGRLAFDVQSLARTVALDPAALRVPPPRAEHRIGELPSQPSPLLLEPAQLRGFRTRAARTPDGKDAPKQGLLAVNGDDLPRYLLLDGVPVVRLAPRGAGVLLDLLRGSYSISARTFLADEITAPLLTAIPARFVAGEAPKPEP